MKLTIRDYDVITIELIDNYGEIKDIKIISATEKDLVIT